MKKDLGVLQAVYPMPVLMVAAYDETGKVNVMNAAWGMICAMDKIALFIDEDHMGPETHMHSASSYSDPNWNRKEYPLSDRKDVQGKGSRKGWKPKK